MKKMDVEIRIPHDWYLFVKTVGSKKPLNVYVDNENEKYTTNFGIINSKYFLFEEEPFRQLDLRHNKLGRPISLEISQIPPTYSAPVPINNAKKTDFLSLLPLIDPAYHGFYKSLTTSERQTRIGPELIVKMMMKTERFSHFETEKIIFLD
ncbi:hypothetical protein PR048_013390, partial [Dryococelus australis]